MRLIDFHTHFFPEKLRAALWKWFETHAWSIEYKLEIDSAVEFLKQQGVTQCVSLHYPHKEGMTRSLNEFAFHLGEQYQDFVLPFGSVHPDDDEKEKLLRECFEKFNFKGLKIHCHVQKVAPDDPRMDLVYQLSGDYGRIVLIHCGTGPHFKGHPTKGYGYDVTKISGVRRFEKVLKKFSQTIFVVPHLGYEEVEGFIGLLKDYPNLHLDTTMALAKYFPVEFKPEWLVENADRLIFGTDFPNIPYPWVRERDNLLAMKLGAEVEAKIFYENAAGLLGLGGRATAP